MLKKVKGRERYRMLGQIKINSGRIINIYN